MWTVIKWGRLSLVSSTKSLLIGSDAFISIQSNNLLCVCDIYETINKICSETGFYFRRCSQTQNVFYKLSLQAHHCCFITLKNYYQCICSNKLFAVFYSNFYSFNLASYCNRINFKKEKKTMVKLVTCSNIKKFLQAIFPI